MSATDVDTRRRTYRVLNEDGLVDLGVGLGLTFAALYVGLDRLAGVKMTAWSGLFPVLVMMLLRGLRKRFVYPRVGYTRVYSSSPAILLMVVVSLVLLAGLVVFTVHARRGMRPPPALFPWLLRLFALAGSGVMVVMAQRTGLVRFYVHSVVLAAAVLVPGFLVRDMDYGLTAMLGFPGVVLLVTGIVCFVAFLRRHPRVATGENRDRA